MLQHRKAAKVSRRFLVVEGIYVNSGDLCNIQDLVPLKHKYKLRFFIDESVSLATLGKSGRGILQQRGIAVLQYTFLPISAEVLRRTCVNRHVLNILLSEVRAEFSR